MINLLPLQEKEGLKQEENFKLVLTIGILILSSLVVLSLILLSIEAYIKGQAQSQKILIDLEKKETSQFKELEEKVISINRDLSNLDTFYQNQASLTQLLEKTSSSLVTGMYLNSFSYQKNTSQVKLAGFCPTIEALSEFKGNLKKEKQFKEIYFPLSNWVQSKDINFSAIFIWSP